MEQGIHIVLDALLDLLKLFFCRERSRFLLSENDGGRSAVCPGGGDQIVDGIQQSTVGLLIIQNVTLCTAGSSQVTYDIGFMDPYGVFVPIVKNAFTTEVFVITGDAIGFRLVVRESAVERTYTIVKSVVAVVLHDQGRNVRMYFNCAQMLVITLLL